MSSVFISYSRHDQAFVRRLHAALEALGRDAWVDWQGIAPTAEWMAEIRRGIDGADAVLFVISPSWLASEVCAQELAHAVQQGKRLVPVVCGDAPASQVPAALAKLNWIFLRESDPFDDGVHRLVAGLDVDLDWVREHTRLIERAQAWQASSEDDAILLRGRELDEAERWLAAGTSHTDPAPVPLQAQFITRSREAARRRQRIVRGLVIAALAVSIALMVWALIERGSAVDNALAAEQAASAARYQEGQARKNEARAVTQEGIAKEQTLEAQRQEAAASAARDAEVVQRKAAQSAQREAERQRDEAVRQRIAAQSRQLAARAEAQPAADPALLQKSALLAAESLRLLPNVEADQALRRSIEQMPVRHAELPHPGIVDTGAMAGDGDFMAFVDARGLLRVIHAGRMQEVFRYDTGGRTRHVQVDRGGRYVLLTSPRDGTLLLYTNGSPPRRIEGCNATGAAFGGRMATQLAIGCHRQLRLIDAADPAVPVRVFEDADGSQLALDFRGDSEQLAGVDDRGTITVWNVADGKRIARVPGQDSSGSSWSICCTAFIGYSASGGYIVANNLVGERLHVVSTTTWKTHAWLPHGARVNVFAFDPQRDLLASGDRKGRITVWDLPERAIVSRMSHADEITGLRLYASPSSGSEHGPELLSASTDRTARVWQPFSGAELARAAQISPVVWVGRPWEPHYGRRFVTLDNRTGLVQWDMRPPGPPMRLGSQRDKRVPVKNCASKREPGGPGGPQHWIFDGSGLVGWDPGRPAHNAHMPFFDAKRRPVLIDPDCRWLAVSGSGELRIVDPAASGSAAGSIEHPLFVDALEAGVGGGGWWRSPRGGVLALRGDSTGLTRVWRTSPWARLDAPADCKAGPLIVSPDERSLALGCGDSLRVYDLASGRQTASLVAPGAVGLTDDGRLVLRDKQLLSVRQLPGGQLLGSSTLPEALSRGTLAIDRRWLAVASDSAVGLWRVPTLERRALVVRDAVPTPGGPRKPFGGELAFSPDGRHLLVHGLDRLHVYDTEPWALRSELMHPGSASLVQWDLAARRVLAQVAHQPLDRDLQHGVRAWHIDSGAELLRLPLERPAGILSISGDGRYLLADQVYRLSSQALLDVACRQVARNLTAREWQAEFGAQPYQRTCPSLPEPANGTPSWDQ